MIDSINLQSLRNADFIQFNANTLGIVQRNNPEALHVQEQYDLLVLENNIILNLFKTDVANPITDTINTADVRRGDAFNGINTVLLGFTYHFDVTIKQQATLLHSHLASYGTGIARLNYQSKTLTIKSIVSDWTNNTELGDAITLLKLENWKIELEQANSNFDSLYLDRTQNMATASPDTMKAKRLDAINAFYDLRNNINAQFTINKGKDPFAKVTNELNALISQYNILLAGRSGDSTDVPTEKEIISTPAV